MILSKILALAGVFLYLLSQGQHIDQNSKTHQWIVDSVKVVASIDPTDTTTSDLLAIAREIGEARVVLLGEQDHGDGGAFLAKTRLIKFLNSRAGFDVLAFESGFYELNALGFKAFDNSEKIRHIRGNLHGVWSKSQQMIPLFDYIQENPSLAITGFDSRHSFAYSRSHYASDLDSAMTIFGLAGLHSSEWLRFKSILNDLLLQEYNHRPSPDEKSIFYSTIKSIRTHLVTFLSNDYALFWEQEMQSLEANAKSVWLKSASRKIEQESINVRDEQMASNILWLATKKYPSKKIIIWAANYHIAKNLDKIPRQRYFNSEKNVVMGNILARALGNNLYSIAIISGSGQYTDFAYNQMLKDIEVHPDSFEAMLMKSGVNFGFISLKENNIPMPSNGFYLSGLNHYSFRGQWNYVFDSLFFIRRMTPSIYVRK